MSSFEDVASGTVGGAMAGSTFGLPGAVVGGVIGGVSSLFGKSAYEQRRDSFNQTMSMIQALKSETERRRQTEITKGVRTLGRYGQSMMSGVRGGAASRMSALGRGGEAESAILPAEQNVAEVSNRNITGFTESTNARYNQDLNNLNNAQINAQMDYNRSPTEPSTGQTLLTLGSGISQYGQTKSYIDALKNYSSEGGPDYSTTGTGYMGSPSNPSSLANAGKVGNPWHI